MSRQNFDGAKSFDYREILPKNILQLFWGEG